MLAAAPLLGAPGPVLPTPIDPPCTTLLGAPTPRTFAVALPDGTRVTLLDRYGGYIPRNRLFSSSPCAPTVRKPWLPSRSS